MPVTAVKFFKFFDDTTKVCFFKIINIVFKVACFHSCIDESQVIFYALYLHNQFAVNQLEFIACHKSIHLC